MSLGGVFAACCCQAVTVPYALFPFPSVFKSWVSPGDGSDQKCQNENADTKEVISNTSGQFAVLCALLSFNTTSLFSNV